MEEPDGLPSTVVADSVEFTRLANMSLRLLLWIAKLVTRLIGKILADHQHKERLKFSESGNTVSALSVC